MSMTEDRKKRDRESERVRERKKENLKEFDLILYFN